MRGPEGSKKAIQRFREKSSDKHQPAQKLQDATVSAARRRSVDQLVTGLKITNTIPSIGRDRRITYGGRIAQMRAECVALTDRFLITQALKSTLAGASINAHGCSPGQLARPFFENCQAFIDECGAENLPKLGVEATIYYARTARSYESYCQSTKTDINRAFAHTEEAKELLEEAKDQCVQEFENAEGLRRAVQESIKLLRRQWYEPVSKFSASSPSGTAA